MVQCREIPMNHQRKQCRKQYYDEEHYIGFTSALENIVILHITSYSYQGLKETR